MRVQQQLLRAELSGGQRGYGGRCAYHKHAVRTLRPPDPAAAQLITHNHLDNSLTSAFLALQVLTWATILKVGTVTVEGINRIVQ